MRALDISRNWREMTAMSHKHEYSALHVSTISYPFRPSCILRLRGRPSRKSHQDVCDDCLGTLHTITNC